MRRPRHRTICLLLSLATGLALAGERVEKTYYDAERTLLRAETPMKDGKPHGVTRRYGRNGKLLEEVPYDNGKVKGAVK